MATTLQISASPSRSQQLDSMAQVPLLDVSALDARLSERSLGAPAETRTGASEKTRFRVEGDRHVMMIAFVCT